MTKLQIANAAVSQLGDDSSITDLDDTANNKANAVRVWWPIALAEFLREFHWNWAKTRTRISRELITAINGAFTMPAVNASTNVTVDSALALAIGDILIVGEEQWFEVEDVLNATDIVLINLGGHQNVAAGQTVADNLAVYRRTEVEPDFGWASSYPLPDDFVAMVGLNEKYPTTPSDLWEIEGGYLLTDEDEADIEYIYTPSASALDTFLGRMDGLSLTAFTTLLASKIATRIAKDGGQMALSLKQQYLAIDLPRARCKNANENRPVRQLPALTSINLASRNSFTNP